MKNLFNALGVIIFFILLIVCGVYVVMYQFNIYQKKHGKHMTFMDFMFDSERKR